MFYKPAGAVRSADGVRAAVIHSGFLGVLLLWRIIVRLRGRESLVMGRTYVFKPLHTQISLVDAPETGWGEGGGIGENTNIPGSSLSEPLLTSFALYHYCVFPMLARWKEVRQRTYEWSRNLKPTTFLWLSLLNGDRRRAAHEQSPYRRVKSGDWRIGSERWNLIAYSSHCLPAVCSHISPGLN